MLKRKEKWIYDKKTFFFNYILVAVILILISVACYKMFLFSDIRLVPFLGYDTTAQMLPGLSLVEESWSSGEPFWSWSLGLGGDVMKEMAYYYSTSPFYFAMWIIKSFLGVAGSQDFSVMADWALISTIVKQSLIMFLMYVLLRKEEKNWKFSIIGAVVYGLVPWFLKYSISFNFMTDGMIWLPCIMMAIGHYEKSKRALPLIVVVALMVGNSFYFGYMTCVFSATVMLIYSYHRGDGVKKYIERVSKYLGISITGVLIASPLLMAGLSGFLDSLRGTKYVELDFFPRMEDLLSLPYVLFTENYLFMLPGFILLAIGIKYKKASASCKKKSFLALFWIMALIIPAMATMMSGFSYATDRWHYIVVFAVAYAIPDWLEEIIEQKTIGLRKALAFSSLLIIIFFLPRYKMDGGSFNVEDVFYLVVAIGGILIVGIQKYNLKAKTREILLVALVLLTCVNLIAGNFGTVRKYGPTEPYSDEYMESMLCGEGQRQINLGLVPKSNEFYRVSDTSISDVDRHFENRAWTYGTYGIAVYNSLLNGDIVKWHLYDYNIQPDVASSVVLRGFDNRYYLETAWGVKYKINGASSEFRGYEEGESSDELAPLLNKNSVGIDMWYPSISSQEEFNRWNYGQRDGNILQTAVVGEEIKGNYPQTQLMDITRTKELSLNEARLTNCQIRGNILHVEENGKVSFDGMGEDGDGEQLLAFKIKDKEDKNFLISVNGNLSESLSSTYKFGHYIENFSFRVGGDAKTIDLNIAPGEYYIENIVLTYNPYEPAEGMVAARNKYNLENLYVKHGRLKGTIENQEGGILALSIPKVDGWKCKVDGNKTPITRVNGMFSGIELLPGNHVVEFYYTPTYMVYGVVASIGTILLMVAICIIKKKKDKTRMFVTKSQT